MKSSRYTEPQIIAILRQAEGGIPVAELCREHGMSGASFYKWHQATQWLWTYNNDRPNMGVYGITPVMKLKLKMAG